MEFKYSLSILFSNMGYVLKIFLWVLLSLIIVAAVGVAILLPIFNFYEAQTGVADAITAIQGNLSDFVNANVGIKQFITDSYHDIIALVTAAFGNVGATVGLIFAIIFLYLLYSFLSGLSLYPTADIVNKIMSSNMRFGFASNMALNFKKAVKYSACRLLLTFPADIIILGIMLGLGYGLMSAFKIFALPVLLIVALLLLTLRAMLFSGWLPRMLFHPEEKVFTSWTRSFPFVKANFKGFFKAYFITFICAYLLVFGFSIITFGLIAVLVPSLYYFLLRTVELVGYYKLKGLCFYTDASTVINTVEFGYRLTNQDGADEDDSTDLQDTDTADVSGGFDFKEKK